jgi:hypothetical protein
MNKRLKQGLLSVEQSGSFVFKTTEAGASAERLPIFVRYGQRGCSFACYFCIYYAFFCGFLTVRYLMF